MTPHSVGGSLNELGEARGTVLAVKLDRQEKGRKNHQLGRHVCKVIHFPRHYGIINHMVSMSILEGVVVCDPFKCFLYGG